MSWSLGEVEQLVRKAVRGSGRPWGVAEEAGWTVRWLSARGFPGPESFVACLTAELDECPVFAGIALSDTGRLPQPRRFPAVVSPMIMLPFLARLCPSRVSVSLLVGDVRAKLGHDDLIAYGRFPDRGAITLESVGMPVSPAPKYGRVGTIGPDALSLLEAYAARTYAPATEESRILGAGAGLSDND